jgi:excinuclease UvrABC nuclease subunit
LRNPFPQPEFTGEFEAPPCELGGAIVYQLLDSQGECFYVGVSSQVFGRIQEHIRNPAKGTAYRVRWEWFEEREDALRREATLINQLDPRDNIIGRPVWAR